MRRALLVVVVVVTCLADWAFAITRLAPQSEETVEDGNSSRFEGWDRFRDFLSTLKKAEETRAPGAKLEPNAIDAGDTGSRPLASFAAWVKKQQAERAARSAAASASHSNGTKRTWANFASWIKREMDKATHNSTGQGGDQASHTPSESNVRKPDWAGFASWAKEQLEKAVKGPSAMNSTGSLQARGQVAKATTNSTGDVETDKAPATSEAAVQEVAGSVAAASSEAAASAAKDSLGKFMSWLKEQGDAAARKAAAQAAAAQGEAEHQALAETQKAEENAIDLAMRVWGVLMDKAKATALQTVKGKAAEQAKQAAEAFSNLTGGERANLSTDPNLFEAWSSANKAWDKLSAADKAERSSAEIAASAAWIVEAGHNVSKVLSWLRRPGATSAALKALTAAGEKARESTYESYVAGNGASDVKDLFANAVRAAMRTNRTDWESASWAVARTYSALEKASQDALLAARHANDATRAVARAVAEVGWRAVSETLASELTLAKTVAYKVSAAKDVEKFYALAEGLTQAKKVAQIAWLKGLSAGLQRPASAEALSKFARASRSVAHVSHAWINAVSNAMQEKEAQQAVAKAASAAATAASTAAAKASCEQAKRMRDMFRTAAAGAGRPAWMKPGSSATTFTHWTSESGLSLDSVNKYNGMSTMGHLAVKPNDTHFTLEGKGRIVTPVTGALDASVIGHFARSRDKSTDGSISLKSALPFVGPAENMGEFRVDPIPHAEHIRALTATGTLHTRDRYLKGVLNGARDEDGRGFLKGHLSGQIPEMTDNLDATFNVWQPFPARNQALR